VRTLCGVTSALRTPVIVGAAQVSQTPADDDSLSAAPDPIDLMAAAVQAAAEDSGSDRTLRGIGSIAVIGGLWRFRNPAALIADALALPDAQCILTTFGGNLPIHATHLMAERIAAGEVDVAVIVGGECTLSRRKLAARGAEPVRRPEDEGRAVEQWGPPLDMGDPVAADRGGEVPRNSYAVLDSAIRAARGETLDAARDRAARLWAGYAAVAARNPHAADRSAPSAAEIRDPSPNNRMVSWPYTKAMCANNTVDHAGAIILCAAETADELGIAPERRVHPHRCVTASDTASLLRREHIHIAPGLRAGADRVIETVGSVEAIDHLDLYACFPSIVTLTAEALGLDLHETRPLTVTGGLAFAGAPLNFAAGESLVKMISTLRNDPGSLGLVQGNGGHAAKHAFGIYSTEPSAEPHRIEELGSFDTTITVASPDRSGSAVIDGVTVEYARTGPERVIAITRFDDGTRSWAVSHDPDMMQAVTEEEWVGRVVSVDHGEMRPAQPA
jgi:acetyl-CoA C-acetyltransferase